MENSKNNILVVAAHPDDEILGLGGTILKHIAEGDDVSIVILGDGESSRGQAGDIAKRQDQANLVAKKLGVKEQILLSLPDNKFDTVPLLDIIKETEKIILKVRPNIIYTHHGRDLNIDHCLTFQAVLTACRPQPGAGVKKILSFETLSSTEWQKIESANMFCPNIFVNIEQYLDEKFDILSIYKDELKEFPHPRSLEGVKTLAKYRGMQIGYNYAEAFELIRSIE